MRDPDPAIAKLLRASAILLDQGADPAHHRTYQDTVRMVGARVSPEINPDDVTWMRGLYADSVTAQRNGEPRQSTYRRALVDVLAARLSQAASQHIGRPVVISPMQARLVLDSRPASGATFTQGSHADPHDVIDAATRPSEREQAMTDPADQSVTSDTIDVLIEKSSFGTPGARSLRERTSLAVADAIVERSRPADTLPTEPSRRTEKD